MHKSDYKSVTTKNKRMHIHHEPRMVCYEDDAAPKSNPKSNHYSKNSKKKEKG